MAKRRRIYSAPLIVTVAAWVGPACSNSSPEYIPAQTGGVGSGGNQTGGSHTGGSSTGGASSGGGGVGGDAPGLPECRSVGYSLVYSECEPGDACNLPMTCTSGTPRNVMMVCRENGQGYAPSSEEDTYCEHPYEACMGEQVGYYCVDESWVFQGGGGNPPAPCPVVLPQEGADCNFGLGFGADRSACGYPCEDGSWTVTGCTAAAATGSAGSSPREPGQWTSDGVCEAQGGDGGR